MSHYCLKLLFLGFHLRLLLAAPVPNYPPKEMIGFMKSYGYLPNTNGSQAETLYTEEGFREVIRQVQRFGGLNDTGELDNATLALMDQPRCGVPDVIREEQNGSGNRTKRYILATKGWSKRHLTYYLSNWAPNLDRRDVSDRLRQAFSLWSEISPLRFSPLHSPDADLIVSFGRGDHGDYYPFDGPGNTLAHAFFPYQHGPQGGDVHFDSDEAWVDNHGKMKPKQGGVDFLSVATHEIGHSLGLAHSTAEGSIMFPYYKGHSEYLKLGYDDVLAMHDLYVRQAMFEDAPLRGDDMESERRRYGVSDTDRDRNRPQEPPRRPPEPPRRTPEPPKRPSVIPVIPYIPSDGDTNGKEDRGHNGGTDRAPPKDQPTIPPRNQPTVPTRDRDERPRHPVKPEHPNPPAEEPRRPVERRPDDHDRRDNRPGLPPRVPERPRDEDRDSKDNRTKIPDLCKGRFDSAALLRNELFIFKGKFMWRFKDRGLLMRGYPARFHLFFRGLPKSIKRIDAIYERHSDHSIVIFTGRQVWYFTGGGFTAESPRALTDLGLPAHLESLDAAFVWSKNDKTYFFKGHQYWRYDDRAGKMDDGYPEEISSRWTGVPNDVDTAMTFKDDQTYFFKDRIYWRFDNIGVQTDYNFPRNTSEDWVGC